jgi:RNA polymerase sigma factor (sigma-70 family)
LKALSSPRKPKDETLFGFAFQRELPYEIAMDDHELLRAFARDRSQEAFRQLVDRHLRLVYAAAHRIVRDPHLAEEVAQNVFTLLAQKAGGIVPPQVLAGWLYNSTRHMAMHCVRTEQRRREREQTAVAMNALTESDGDTRFVAEHLEEALAELDPADRDALVLRYLDDRTLRDVGRELGVSEDAARMRVNRATERVRAVFQRRGANVTAIGFAAAVASVSAAPPAGLAVSVTSAVLAATTSTAVTQGVLMHWFTTKTTLVATATAVLAGGGTYLTQSRETARIQKQVAGLMQGQQSAQADLEAAQAKIASLNKTIELMGQVQDDQNALRAENIRLKQSLADIRNEEAQSRLSLEAAKRDWAKQQAQLSQLAKFTNSFDGREIQIEPMSALKKVSVAARVFFSEQKRYPKSYDEMAEELGDSLEPFARSTEMVPGAQLALEDPNFILTREKHRRMLPDGRWERVYGFADGSVQRITQDSPDFSAFEAQHLAPQ